MRFLLILYIFLSGCASLKSNNRIENFTNIKKWGYQLQNYKHPYDLVRIFNLDNMLWTLDYSSTGEDNNRFKNQEIDILKKKGHIIVSYISIGEAEEVRYYFKNMDKDLIVSKNPEFPDNHKIKYWEESWQNIFLEYSQAYGKSYLDRIIEAGFDGLYLDIVDAFTYFENKKERADQMVDFMVKISKYCKSKNPNFLIIQQNAPSLIHVTSKKKLLLETIDAIAMESIFFGGEERDNNSLNIDNYVLKDLEEYKKNEIPIFSVEYIQEPNKIKKYFELAEKYDLIPLAAERELKGKLYYR